MSKTNVQIADQELMLFDEQYPNSSQYLGDTAIHAPFKSECPPDAKIKIENLFSFKRKRGDTIFSVLMVALALFFLVFFWTESGWDKRKLPDDLSTYLAYQFGITEIDGRVTRFGKILKQSWVAPLLCLLIFVPTAIWNLRNAWFVHRWRQRFQLPTSASYELEQWFKALEFVGYFIVYTLAVPILGYLLSTLLLGSFLTWRLGYRSKKWIGISLIASFVVVIVFRTFLQIKTPGNIWLYDLLPVAAKSFMLSYF